MRQTTDHVLMVRPVRFSFNEETAVNNAFQQKPESSVSEQAVGEFDGYVALLRQNGVRVDVLQDTPEPLTPDSIFPNNCFSTHQDEEGRHTLVLYPMFAHNRRLEQDKLLRCIHPDEFNGVVDLRCYAEQGQFLEGTGSMVLDREEHIAYACLSPRTDQTLLRKWAERMGYDVLSFESQDEHGTPVYHTNVMMHVGSRLAVVCLDSVYLPEERARLVSTLEQSGKTIVEISHTQMNHFAGNMLELHNARGEQLLVMSRTALQSLTEQQVALLEQDVRIVAPDIHTIERVGGGSARCMIAELYI